MPATRRRCSPVRDAGTWQFRRTPQRAPPLRVLCRYARPRSPWPAVRSMGGRPAYVGMPQAGATLRPTRCQVQLVSGRTVVTTIEMHVSHETPLRRGVTCSADQTYNATENACMAPNCVLLYMGARNFYNSSSELCMPVPTCLLPSYVSRVVLPVAGRMIGAAR